MNLQQIINDTKYNIRTQISLSPSLYQAIKEKAEREEKSMASVIRQHVVDGIVKERKDKKKDRERLKHLTDMVRDLNGKSGWAKVKDPRALIRKWRREDDEKRARMMEKAR